MHAMLSSGGLETARRTLLVWRSIVLQDWDLLMVTVSEHDHQFGHYTFDEGCNGPLGPRVLRTRRSRSRLRINSFT